MITSAALGPVLLAMAGAGQQPEPSPVPTEPAHTIYTVTPGISGFIAFFVLALAGWLLFRSLVKHVRKVDLEAARRKQPASEATGDSRAGAGDSRAGTNDARAEASAPSSDPAARDDRQGRRPSR